MVGAVPREIGALNVARFDAGHFTILVVLRIDRTPLPVVPLPDKATPVLDIQVDSLHPDIELCHLVALSGRSQNVKAIEAAGREFDHLPAWDHRIRGSRLGGGKAEMHTVEGNLRGQHFGWQSVTLAVETRVGFLAVVAGNGRGVVEINWLRVHGCHLCWRGAWS